MASRLQKGINKLVKTLFQSYTIRAPRQRPKAFHDAIWGTQIFAPCEVAILDSPLLQRLRHVYQTGLAYQVFPSARHSRFEHTIGVVATATKMAVSINAKFLRRFPQEPPLISPKELQELRLAALFHDCSHGLFSHASERVYSEHPWLADFKRDKPYFAEVKSSELLAYLIITSDEFNRWWESLRNHFKDDEVLQSCNKDAFAKLIIGKAPDDKAFLGDIINGPFDADKLDYIQRDGYFTGLKLMIDVDRLLYALDVGDVSEELPNGTKKTRRRLIISWAGVTALEQILMSKLQLYANVYQHPKVRAAESWLETTLFRLMNEQNADVLFATPVDFLRWTDTDFLAINESTANINRRILMLARSLRTRELPMRVLVISKDTVASRDDLKNLLLDIAKGSWHFIKAGLEDLIYREVQRKHGRLNDFYIIVDFPRQPPLNEPEQTWVQIRGSERKALMSEHFKTMEWLETFTVNKWRGHIFCPFGFEDKVRPIAKEVLQERLKLRLNPLAEQLISEGREV